METVGQSKERNDLAKTLWSRDQLLRSIVKDTKPVIVDVGAHRGESALLFRRIFQHAKIFSFEPDPDSFLALSTLGLEDHTLFNIALSDRPGVTTFYRNAISHTNSLFPVNFDSKDSISLSQLREESLRPPENSYNQIIKVEASTLDSIAAAQGIKHISLLKIDVQGAESLVLSGAQAALSFTDSILLEIALFDYYKSSSSFYAIEEQLRSFGFSLYAITDISQNPMNGRTDWVEVLYVCQNS